MARSGSSVVRTGSGVALTGAILAVLLTSCSAESLPEELVATSAEALAHRADAIELDLAPADAACAVRRLEQEEADALGAALTPDVAAAVADAVVECVGADVIARAALTPFTSGASDASLACAGDRLDDELISALVAGRLADNPVPRAEVELAVVAALSLCLEPAELRGRG